MIFTLSMGKYVYPTLQYCIILHHKIRVGVVVRISGNLKTLCECVMAWSAPAELSVFSVHSLNHQSVREVQIQSNYLCITSGAQSKKKQLAGVTGV